MAYAKGPAPETGTCRGSGTSPSTTSLSRWSRYACIVSAPGKVILSGEYSVVYGKEAIASALSLRTQVLVVPSGCTDATITLGLQDLHARLSWDATQLPWDAVSSVDNATIKLSNLKLDPALRQALEQVMDKSVARDLPADSARIARMASLSFLYMFMSIYTAAGVSMKDLRGCTFVVRSQLPIGSGLGSSASLGVCLATALLLQAGLISAPPSASTASSPDTLALISRWAFVSELCIHGNPSGIDNTVATYGGTLVFRPGGGGRDANGDGDDAPETMKMLPGPVPHRFVLVDTRRPRSSSAQLLKVAGFREACPGPVAAIMDAIAAVTRDVTRLLSSSSQFHRHNIDALEDINRDETATATSPDLLGRLLRTNHNLLSALGVSHPTLETVCNSVYESGLGYGKLTGAGGGGCALVMLNASSGHAAKDSARARLEWESDITARGYRVFGTTLGGSGVGVIALK